tara:strand:+ start:761 stop:1084 length:324 start_codon:yes stop_codon:yes gene_type:complete
MSVKLTQEIYTGLDKTDQIIIREISEMHKSAQRHPAKIASQNAKGIAKLAGAKTQRVKALLNKYSIPHTTYEGAATERGIGRQSRAFERTGWAYFPATVTVQYPRTK